MRKGKVIMRRTTLSVVSGSLLVYPHLLLAATTDAKFRLLPVANDCPAEEALTCWIREVFKFSQTAILLLSTVVIITAGIIYMTSAGNTKQIELAKKLIFGALSGVAVIVLGRFFLTAVVGLPWA